LTKSYTVLWFDLLEKRKKKLLIIHSPVGCWPFYVVTSGPAVHPLVSL